MKILKIIILSFILTGVIIPQVDSLTISRMEFYQSTEDTSAYIRIYYPQISGLNNPSVENKINSFLQSEFMQSKTWYDDFVSDTEAAAEFPPDWVFTFETDYRITYNKKGFVSIVLDYYEFTGGAHGNFYSIGYNIRTTDGNVLTLSDILKENSVDALSEFCTEEILNMFEANSLTEAGLFEDELNLTYEQDFFVKPNTLIIQFDPYEIGPFAMGSIEVELNFDKIKNILKNDLPFLK